MIIASNQTLRRSGVRGPASVKNDSGSHEIGNGARIAVATVAQNA
jgi:hypothetical protein